MLKLFRKKNVAKMVLWGLLILILPAFVLWGTGSLGGSKKNAPKFVGMIDGRRVTFDNFAKSIVSVRSQVLLKYYDSPKTMNLLLKNKPIMGKLAWDRLIMLKEAQANKITVSDNYVITYIRSLPIFLRGGSFDEKIYAYLLKNNIGLDARSFEEMMRENLSIKKLNETLTKDIKVADEEIIEFYKDENRKFKISYALFPLSDFLDKTKVSDKEVRDYYDAHKEDFLLPAKEGDIDETPRLAGFDDMKEGIKAILAEDQARGMALKHAGEERKNIAKVMKEKGQSFEKAAWGLGLKVAESPFFVRSDYLEGIGEALPLALAAVGLEKGEVAGPVGSRSGPVIFMVAETQDPGAEKMEKEKEEYSKKLLDKKKDEFLSDWLRRLELKASLNIDLKDYEKYYR